MDQTYEQVAALDGLVQLRYMDLMVSKQRIHGVALHSETHGTRLAI